LTNAHCEIGENPYWDATARQVYWTDISVGRIFAFDTVRGYRQVLYSGPPVGGFTQQSDGKLLLFRLNDIALLWPDEHVESVIKFRADGMERFNDVIADPEGRVFAGTIGACAGEGGLYRVDRDGSITKLIGGTQCSNGMGFSPQLDRFYWTCTTRNQIWEFDYCGKTGNLSGGRVICQVPLGGGLADGLTVDLEGNLWSARWDGGRVVQHAPTGQVLREYEFPVRRVSSVCFGGEQLDTLFVTTAGGTEASNTDEGALFQLRVEASGRPEFKSRILL